MLKVMLIDDEQNILTGLSYLIDWNAQGFEICGSFTNPAQALEQAPKLCPDLIITDIEMPGTSGLDLIATLREALPKSLFVILSAYEEFQYAKRAVELGAFQYLLKPLSAEELTGLLLNVKEHFSVNDPVRMELSAFRSFVVREVVINGLELCYAVTIPYYKQLLDNTKFQLVLVNATSHNGTVTSSVEAMEKLQRLFASHSIFSAGDCIAMLLQVDQAEATSKIKKVLDPWIVEVSDSFIGLAEAHLQYKQLTKSMQAKLFWEGRQQISKFTPVSELPDDETMSLLHKAVWFCDTTALESAFAQLLNQISGLAGCLSKHDVVRIYEKLFRFVGTMLQNVSSYNLSHQTIGIRLFDCRTLSQVHACALQEFYTILDDIRSSTNDTSLNLIRQAKAHIVEHYMETDYRLTDIADALFVNYSYLSNLFKQETGDTLSNYLLKQRMNQAKKLLCDPFLTVAEVSQRVGYHNVKTFYSTFKKYYGESPRSYQQHNTNRKY